MKYYISHVQKNKDFYFLGELTPTSFESGHAYEFIKAYLAEYPGLMDEIHVNDEAQNVCTLSEFFDKIKKN